MTQPQRRFSESVTTRRLKEGRGKGRGTNYKPWLHIQDIPFKGDATHEKGWVRGRPHHLLSGLECAYLFLLEWEP